MSPAAATAVPEPAAAPARAVPKVSVGLPVYNGERYVARAVESLLAQSHRDFELIIVDNASTDRTGEICRGFAARDARVRYVRNEENIGAAPNFNRACELARGEYFKWAAHDDVCAPELLARCVAVLDADPGVVLCYSRTTVIDENGAAVETYPSLAHVDSPDPVARFRSLARLGHKRYEVFGLIRRAALRRAGMIGRFASGDCVLVVRLCLEGRLHELPEPLLAARRHGAQSMEMVLDFYAYSAWFDPARRGKLIFPYWRVLGEHLRSVVGSPLRLDQKLRCAAFLLRWIWTARGWLRGELKTGALVLAGRRRIPTA